MDRIRIRAAALTAAAALFAVACGGPSGGGTSETLATDQTLRFDNDNELVRQVRVGRHPNTTTRVRRSWSFSSP